MAYEQYGFSVGCYVADVNMIVVGTWQYAGIWLGPAANVSAGTGTGNAALQPQGSLTTPPLGILQNNPVQGEAGSVVISGISKAIAGGALTIGAPVMFNSAGAVVPATTGNWVVGSALETAATGDITSVLLRGMFKM